MAPDCTPWVCPSSHGSEDLRLQLALCLDKNGMWFLSLLLLLDDFFEMFT